MFGTDGVRGTPGQSPLDARTIARLGAATVRSMGPRGVKILTVRDTRESGPWIEQQLARGVVYEGGQLVSAGVLPTPAGAFLVASEGFDGALVISASHNAFPDNGIKVLNADGEKISPGLEAELQSRVADNSWEISETVAPVVEKRDFSDNYCAHVSRVLADCDFVPPLRVAVDCANGAMWEVAPKVLRQLGFNVVTMNVNPDGRNINANCGSTHSENLQKFVKDRHCQLGIAFDGDGDRAILVDHQGVVVDGDAMLFICARFLQARAKLPQSAVVATVMSNIGLELALRVEGVALHRCQVGDRQVRDAMVERGIALGGEQSGHLIFSDFLPTGDGLLTALSIINVICQTGQNLVDLRSGLEVYPQVLVNVPVRIKPDLSSEPNLADVVQSAERVLGSNGRVLVRYSGTEPLLRVMIEGKDLGTVQQLAESIANRAHQLLG